MPALTTHSKLIATGVDLLSREGLAGLSLGRLAEAAGISKSGLFAHIRSKEQLSIELLDAAAVLAQRVVVNPALELAPGLPRLRRLIDGWLGWSARAGLSGGCPVAAALFELDDVEGPLKQHVSALEARWRGLLAMLVREAAEAGELRRDVDVDQFVWELCGVYLSHHASVRFIDDPKADARAKAAVDGLVSRSAPAPNAESAA